ncbi:Transporter [Fusobacterium nucleatum subsp. nucleatum ATCC 25586]|uniref:Transporter n=1 Tax=Fusobacterium nucleatum subsp. nucleatum (strain ATCC 25586 / DSM 15643 / BCRC 10681 / CIP 101130 / JCM 8532 / KCTC 2640 / LMG 13131 / VPI 4355) TaxID=190304 RepID=Q8RH96_FUSNN|nr:Transporter [Fusobacterium nucleatum subsp. nucleatum ATCC 25586]
MGLITNFLSIIMGGILGLTIGKKFNEDIKNIIVDCAGIFIIVIGIKSALVAQKDIMILIYLIIGAVIGQLINIDKRIKNFSQFLEDKFVKEKNSLNNEKSFAKAFQQQLYFIV